MFFPYVRLSVSLSVRPSIPMEQLGSHWKDFHEITYEYFSKICRKNLCFIKIWQEWRVLYVQTDTHDHIPLSSSSNEKCFRRKF